MEAIFKARRITPFATLQDLVRRTRLNEASLSALAEAGAFDSLHVDRRTALWDIRRLVRTEQESMSLPAREKNPGFAPLSNLEEVNWDLSQNFSQHAAPSARTDEANLDPLGSAGLAGGESKEKWREICYAGLVICRQRAGTASGVVFMTLEDESGFVNVVIWESVFRRNAVLAKTLGFLGISGTIQAEDGVVHLIAEELWGPRVTFTPVSAPSRDFH